MTRLTTLPNELLILIYQRCALKSALDLAAVNHKLHLIWVKNTEKIVKAVLAPQIPAIHEAISFAVLEARLLQVSAEDSWSFPTGRKSFDVVSHMFLS